MDDLTHFAAIEETANPCDHIGTHIITVYSDGGWEGFDEKRSINSSATCKVKCITCGNVKLIKNAVVFRNEITGELC